MATESVPAESAEESWSYLQIQPSTDQLDTNALTDTFKRLHALAPSLEIEVRLVVDDGVRTFYVGAASEHASTLRQTLRRLFPSEAKITDTAPPPEPPQIPDTALELLGRGERHDDWQTRLQPVLRDEDAPQFPLAAAVDTLATTDSTVVYQAMLTPKRDWRATADARIDQLERDRDTLGQRLFAFIEGDVDVEPNPTTEDPKHRERIESIRAADKRRSFVVNARAVAEGPDATATLRELANAFTSASGSFYEIRYRLHTDEETTAELAERIDTHDCVTEQSLGTRLRQRLPLTDNRNPAIVADPATVPNFCLLDGNALTEEGRRAMEATPEERTGVPIPEADLLNQYNEGLLLGYPLTTDDEAIERAVSLPPTLQPLHAAWFGKTGSGKSTALINAMLENTRATEGADILIDPKGDGMPVEYLRAHYAEYGDLDDVYYFDCSEVLPAISFFDIRDQLADGIDRTTAVENVVDHYIEILVGIMGRDRFESAVRSPDIIKYLVKAMFDPVHGDDAFSHRELQDATRRMHDTRDAPPVVDADLQQLLSGVAANSKRSFDELMQGVANRIEKIPLDDRLAQLFNNVPEGDDPHFDFREVIDEDAVVIIDTGGLRTESQQALTLVILSQLWTALQRRAQTTDDDDPPLVNLYLEEAASVGTSGLLTDLLAQSRSFGLSMTLAMQFPAQLRQADQEAYAELLNNVSTIVTGNVAIDDDLAKRLATEEMPPSEVANRLRALRRGQWIASLPSRFGVDEPRPFLLESAPIPSGHPESDEPFSAAKATAFDAAFDIVRDRSRLEYGLDLAMTTRKSTMDRHAATTDSDVSSQDPEIEHTEAPTVDTDARVDSALPYTERMPDTVDYDAERHALVCAGCENRYDPSSNGMRRALNCCHTPADFSRDNVPLCELNLKLSVDERRQTPYTDAQLRFLQAVYSAHQQQFNADLEFNLLYDSMVRLQEYVGVSHEEVQELLDAGLLAEDCTYPHKLYTVTAEGRDVANIDYSEGVAYGHGKGDLGESSLHVMMVELGRQYIDQHFVGASDSAAVEARTYYEIDDHRLDAVGLDTDGNVVVAVEAERSNHDTLTAVPTDYDKMAELDPEAAVWIVKNREGAHEVLRALNEPADGDARIDKMYSENTPPQDFKLGFAGMTELHTLQYLRDSVLE
jgi:DNA helicase HerA-like ATPase